MTIPSEEKNSLEFTREFLRELLGPGKWSKKELRRRAGACLRHFPASYVVDRLWEERVSEYDSMFIHKGGSDD